MIALMPNPPSPEQSGRNLENHMNMKEFNATATAAQMLTYIIASTQARNNAQCLTAKNPTEARAKLDAMRARADAEAEALHYDGPF